MTVQIHRSDYPDYMTYLDAIFAPVGGGDSHVVWDEVEEAWMLEMQTDRGATADSNPRRERSSDPRRRYKRSLAGPLRFSDK